MALSLSPLQEMLPEIRKQKNVLFIPAPFPDLRRKNAISLSPRQRPVTGILRNGYDGISPFTWNISGCRRSGTKYIPAAGIKAYPYTVACIPDHTVHPFSDHRRTTAVSLSRRYVLRQSAFCLYDHPSGCAHNGVLNILDRYKELYKSEPDVMVSGFHMMKKTDHTYDEIQNIRNTAYELKRYHTVFYTCHCTGLPAYDIMKEILGGQLHYVHCGEEI